MANINSTATTLDPEPEFPSACEINDFLAKRQNSPLDILTKLQPSPNVLLRDLVADSFVDRVPQST
jgi:hypothetical protein